MARKKAVTNLATSDARQLYGLANAGNQNALRLLRKQYHDQPALAQLHGDLAGAALGSRLKRMLCDKVPGTALAISENMKGIARQLCGDNPTPLERLLAERVVMCWLDVQDHELRYTLLDNRRSPKEYEWRSRMLDRAHRRYLTAIKTLAEVRRISVSLIQVNIAEKQINALGTGAVDTAQASQVGTRDTSGCV